MLFYFLLLDGNFPSSSSRNYSEIIQLIFAKFLRGSRVAVSLHCGGGGHIGRSKGPGYTRGWHRNGNGAPKPHSPRQCSQVQHRQRHHCPGQGPQHEVYIPVLVPPLSKTPGSVLVQVTTSLGLSCPVCSSASTTHRSEMLCREDRSVLRAGLYTAAGPLFLS